MAIASGHPPWPPGIKRPPPPDMPSALQRDDALAVCDECHELEVVCEDEGTCKRLRGGFKTILIECDPKVYESLLRHVRDRIEYLRKTSAAVSADEDIRLYLDDE